MSNLPEILEESNRVSNIKTMSSREIAKLTDKEHKHVLRDIEVMFENLEVSHLKFEASDLEVSQSKFELSDLEVSQLKFELSDFKETYTKRGKIYPCYHLPKRESLILVSGYDVNLRARIIDRWAELEVEKRQQTKVQKPVSPTSYIKVHQLIEQTFKKAGLTD